MKKMTVLLLAAIFCLCLAACGKMPESEQGSQETHTEATDTEGFEEMQKQRDSSAPSGNVAYSSREPVQQSIELIGPWHLDSEIGAEGWHGTYTVEDEEIHAAHNNYDQSVFQVITAGDNKMYFISETGVLTILCAWVLAAIMYIRAKKQTKHL
ncbi:MAG: hypothetical protein SO005_06685 [Candidatus Choladocola sp.]|nr:hypothetical protein [Candidatus Choladocola sp.]